MHLEHKPSDHAGQSSTAWLAARKAKKPKVRTGCRTCKLRKVKCDETKPECLRCVRFWGACEGYDLLSSKHVQHHPREIRPQSSVQRATGRQLPLLQPRPGPRIENGQQHRYFEVFSTDTCLSLGLPFDSNIWSGLVLQASEQEPFVRDAVLAIGAFTKVLGDIQRLRAMGIMPKEGERCLPMTTDHVQALELYAKAIKGMQTAVLDGGRGIRTALIGCLLVVCFEGFYASHAKAMLHAQSGVRLIQQWLEEKRSPSCSSLSSPAPHIIEDELVHAFNRLDLQVLAYQDTRPLEQHQHFKSSAHNALKGMPSIFLSLQQARPYMDLVIRRSYHFLAYASHAGRADGRENIGSGSESGDCGDLPLGFNSPTASTVVPSWLQAERDSHMAEVLRWTKAFDPLLKSLENSGNDSALSVMGARIMKMLSIKATILLRAAIFVREIEYDDLLPEFTEIAMLAEAIFEPLVSLRKGIVSYTFDPNVLPSLFSLLCKCRDRMLRRRVIRLLTSHFHREATWDSMAIARAGTWLMNVEEEGVETEHIPDHRRARLTKFHVDSMNARIEVCCYQRLTSEDQDVVWKEAVLAW